MEGGRDRKEGCRIDISIVEGDKPGGRIDISMYIPRIVQATTFLGSEVVASSNRSSASVNLSLRQQLTPSNSRLPKRTEIHA